MRCIWYIPSNFSLQNHLKYSFIFFLNSTNFRCKFTVFVSQKIFFFFCFFFFLQSTRTLKTIIILVLVDIRTKIYHCLKIFRLSSLSSSLRPVCLLFRKKKTFPSVVFLGSETTLHER